MKKIIFIFISVLAFFILFVYFLNNLDEYQINLSDQDVHAFFEEFSRNELELISFNQVEDTNTWLAYIRFNNGEYSFSELKEGWNHKLKFISLSTCQDMTYRELKTNKGKYGVVIVNDLDENIAKIKVQSQLKDFETEIDTTHSKTFLKTFKLPENVEETFPATFYYYDENGELFEY